MKDFIEQLKAIIVYCGGNPDEQDINECTKDLLDCLPKGVILIAKERCRQFEEEGWTKEHDSEHRINDLALAASAYAMPEEARTFMLTKEGEYLPIFWPFDSKWWKPTPNDRVKELVKAGALIAAEIDRLRPKSLTYDKLMTREQASNILAEYVKAYWEDDMRKLEEFSYEEVITAMDMGAKALEQSNSLSALNRCLMRESRIQGQAVAILGGQIGIRVGYDKESGYAVLCLCELVEDHKPGDKLEKGWDSYGEQIQLAFKDLKSINIVRTALDYVERAIKDGKLPGEWLDEDEK